MNISRSKKPDLYDVENIETFKNRYNLIHDTEDVNDYIYPIKYCPKCITIPVIYSGTVRYCMNYYCNFYYEV